MVKKRAKIYFSCVIINIFGEKQYLNVYFISEHFSEQAN